MNMLLLISLLLLGTGQDQFGNQHTPSKPGPGLTVLDFAASWCGPCWKALPEVEALHRNGSVRVLVISQDTKKAGRDKLVQKLGLTVPVIWDDGHAWAEKYQPEGMPSTMIVDGNGKVLYKHVGFSPKSWQTFLAELKKQQKENGS